MNRHSYLANMQRIADYAIQSRLGIARPKQQKRAAQASRAIARARWEWRASKDWMVALDIAEGRVVTTDPCLLTDWEIHNMLLDWDSRDRL